MRVIGIGEADMKTMTIGALALVIGVAWVGPAIAVELGEPPVADPSEPHASIKDTTSRRAVTVDNWNRAAVVTHFDTMYAPALGVPMNWTGNAASCTAGSTSQAYLDATFDILNYYRRMVGLGDVSNTASYNQGAQEAALMMSVNNALSHSPPSSWSCWTSSGAGAAGASNLALGNAGPSAMVAYIRDSGAGNTFVGHRRWILCPRLNEFGSGSVGETTRSANALYVFTGFDPRPGTPDVIAWPPEGYVPYSTVYPRWSLSLNTGSSVSFTSATVTMTENGSPIPLTVVSDSATGYCDNTIVWEPSGLSFGSGMDDRTITVTVSNISVSGSPHTEVYDVVVIDPTVAGDLIFDDGFETGFPDRWSAVFP
jgi:uncharacterized protein YkwD